MSEIDTQELRTVLGLVEQFRPIKWDETAFIDRVIESLCDAYDEQQKELTRLREDLSYYAQMKAVCAHDDSSWCDHCPDGGRLARKALAEGS